PRRYVRKRAHAVGDAADQLALGQVLLLAPSQLITVASDVLAHGLRAFRVEGQLQEEVDEGLVAAKAEDLVGGAVALRHAEMVEEEVGVEDGALQGLRPVTESRGRRELEMRRTLAQVVPLVEEGGEAPPPGHGCAVPFEE